MCPAYRQPSYVDSYNKYSSSITPHGCPAGGAGGAGSQPSGGGTPGGTSELLPTPGMGFDSQAPTPGARVGRGMRSKASSYIPSAVSVLVMLPI